MTEQRSYLENGWSHLRFWVSGQSLIANRNLEVSPEASYPGWLDIRFETQ